MENDFSQDDWILTLEKLGAEHVIPYKGGLRSSCPIHRGTGSKAFAVWVDDGGALRSSCHSHQCVKAASLEWVVAKTLETSLKQAVEWLSRTLGRELLIPSGTDNSELVIPDLSESISFCDKEALLRLQEAYPYHPYWKQRGYTEDLVKEYQLSYRGIDNRMVIPVMDSANEFVGMMTRTLDPNDPVKYKWESPNSHKGHWVFGVPQAKRREFTVDGRRTVFMVEGTLDVMHASALGYPAVASQTNRLTIEQAREFLGVWDLVILIPDNDEPGANLVKDTKKYLAPFVEVAVVTLPKGVKDLDEMPLEKLPSFLTSIVEEWRVTCRSAKRRKRNFLILGG